MSQSTLITTNFSRNAVPKAFIRYFDLDIKIVDAITSQYFNKEFPLKKTPTFLTPNNQNYKKISQ